MNSFVARIRSLVRYDPYFSLRPQLSQENQASRTLTILLCMGPATKFHIIKGFSSSLGCISSTIHRTAILKV